MRPRGSPSLVFSRAISIAMISETCSRDPKSGIQGFASHLNLSASVVFASNCIFVV